MNRIRIGVVDDHSLLAEGLAAVLNRDERFHAFCFGKCADDIAVLVGANALDVVIVDLNMPGDAFEAMACARQNGDQTRFLVFTASTDTDHAVKALSSGAAGFVLKGSTAAELSDAIETVHRGDIYITPSFGARVIGSMQTKAAEKQARQQVHLSYREQQIAKLLLQGKQNREIAAALDLSEKTVKSYMTNLMAKLNARNRLEAAMAARRFMADDEKTVSRSVQ